MLKLRVLFFPLPGTRDKTLCDKVVSVQFWNGGDFLEALVSLVLLHLTWPVSHKQVTMVCPGPISFTTSYLASVT